MSLPAGTRIRLGEEPWPERTGCEGEVVEAPNGLGVYPDLLGDDEVIVLLDDDPLVPPDRRHEGWTCVLSTSRLEVLA